MTVRYSATAQAQAGPQQSQHRQITQACDAFVGDLVLDEDDDENGDDSMDDADLFAAADAAEGAHLGCGRPGHPHVSAPLPPTQQYSMPPQQARVGSSGPGAPGLHSVPRHNTMSLTSALRASLHQYHSLVQVVFDTASKCLD